jgi:hypothetical protein
MGMIKDLVDSAGAAILWPANALETGPKTTETVNISQHNKEGVLVVQFTNSAAGDTAFNLHAGIDESNMAAVLDSLGNAIAIKPAAAKKVFHFYNLHATFIKLVATVNGSSGTITGIKIIAK